MRSLALACVLLVSTAAPAVAPLAAAHAQPASRQLAWDGSSRLTMNLGGDLTFTQGPRASVVVSGDAELLPHVIIRDGAITVDPEWAKVYWRDGRRSFGKVNAVVTAPAVESFVYNASGVLDIRNFRQDKLNLMINGAGAVRVAGATDSVICQVNGRASVNLKDLRVADASITLPGSGDVSVAASGEVRVNIIGSGEVRLLTQPASLRQRILGSGRVIGPGEA